MIFGPTPTQGAAGAILAHTQRLPGRVIKKGTVLDAAAIAALLEAGTTSLIAARLEPGDVGEDEAATRLADALLAPTVTGGGFTATTASTGRVNLSATAAGLLRLNAPALHAINAIDEGITVGTLPDYAQLAPGEMVATIKIIPFAVPGAPLAAAATLARASACFTLHPFRALKVGLVLSTLPGLKHSILDGTIEATEARIAALTGHLLPPRICAHSSVAIAAELTALIDEGADILLVAGASAVVDRRDVGPEGIAAAGGEIRHFGMPVDPGNLICLGAIGPRPALVLPGCARSPKLNGIDWVLARLFAGQDVSGADIAAMGVGGLLKDIPLRPLPRARAGARPTSNRPTIGRPVAAVILAAGASSRMAPRNKLLVDLPDGRAMVAHVVDTALASNARPVIVVTGHQRAEIEQALQGRDVQFVHAPDAASGLAASLRSGLRALPAQTEAALVCLGDMPLISPALLNQLIAAWDPEEGRTIILPTHQGRAGNPVLWDRRFFDDIAALQGDQGARRLLREHADQVTEIEIGSDAVLQDFDTPETLKGLGL